MIQDKVEVFVSCKNLVTLTTDINVNRVLLAVRLDFANLIELNANRIVCRKPSQEAMYGTEGCKKLHNAVNNLYAQQIG